MDFFRSGAAFLCFVVNILPENSIFGEENFLLNKAYVFKNEENICQFKNNSEFSN